MAERDILAFDSVLSKIKVPASGDIYKAARTLKIEPEVNTIGLQVSGINRTGSNALSGVSLSGEWNTTGTPTFLSMDITDTASDPDSLLVDLRKNNVSKFLIDKNGNITSDGLGWRDLRASIAQGLVGTDSPALAAFGPDGFVKQYAFEIGDSMYLAAHIDHDIKPGSTVYPHVHWSTDGTSTATVKWSVKVATARGHNQESFGAATQFLIEEAAQGTAWRHMISEDATGFTAPEPDTLILMEVSRITNGGTDNADTVFGLFVDLHYEANRIGSVSRTPDFYLRA